MTSSTVRMEMSMVVLWGCYGRVVGVLWACYMSVMGVLLGYYGGEIRV